MLLLIIAYRANHMLRVAAHGISAIYAHIPGLRLLVLDLDKTAHHTYIPDCSACFIMRSSSAVGETPEPSRAVMLDNSAALAMV